MDSSDSEDLDESNLLNDQVNSLDIKAAELETGKDTTGDQDLIVRISPYQLKEAVLNSVRISQ